MLSSFLLVGASHDSWSGGCGATSSPVEEVGPAGVLQAAFDGEQGVGTRLRPAAPGPLESTADDLLAGAFHAAGPDRQSALPAEVAAHPVRVGLVGADAGGDGFGAVAVRGSSMAGSVPLHAEQSRSRLQPPKHRTRATRERAQPTLLRVARPKCFKGANSDNQES